MELQYKWLIRILSGSFFYRDSEFRSAMGNSSVDIDKMLSKNFFLWIQCPKISNGQKVVKRVKPLAPSNKVCGLCLQEKLSILRSAPSLNKRSEIFGHCIRRKKCLLSNLSMSTDEVSIADRNSESRQEQYRLIIL